MDINKLNGYVRATAAKTGVPHQNIYDMYFFERFLYRLSLSEYKENFVMKGGFLLENMVGMKARTTMDIDLKTVGITLLDKEIVDIFKQIAEINDNDGITYSVLGISDIAAELKYGGKSVKIEARLKNLKKVFSIDIAQGDVVTPYPVQYKYKSPIDDSEFEILAYTTETIIAEKFETLIAKGMSNSRAKDLFDIHILWKQGIDRDRLNAALINTFYVRRTKFNVEKIRETLSDIHSSEYRREVFDRYAAKHRFAYGITFDEVIQSAFEVCDSIKVCKIDLPKITSRITLVRHGEDEQDKIGGWSDNKLTETGVEQIKSLAKTLDSNYDLILSSDLLRAKQSAEILAESLDCLIEYDRGLRETNNGDLKDMTKAEFVACKHKRFVDMSMDESYPNGESPESFYQRVKNAFTEILKKHNGKRLLIITHGGVITVIQCLLNGWHYSNMLKIVPPYATKIEF